MNRPITMYRPTRTNGIPHNLKKMGASDIHTVLSQKIAKPHHIRLNGMR
jgi:hypothetical protein